MLMNNVGLYKSSLQPKATTFTSDPKKEVGQEILDDNNQEEKEYADEQRQVKEL